MAEQEISKHTKKAFKIWSSNEHSWQHKLQEFFIEIAIIVFAVSVSIWFHNRSEHAHQQADVKTFLTDLKEDIGVDTANMHRSINAINKELPNINFLLQLTPQIIDSITKKPNSSLGFSSGISTTKINNGNYEGFKSSGKIGNIEDKKLKKLILKYYQEITPDVLEVEKYNHAWVAKIDDFAAEYSSTDILRIFLDKKFKYMLNKYIDSSNQNVKTYNEAIHIAEEILTEINKELKN